MSDRVSVKKEGSISQQRAVQTAPALEVTVVRVIGNGPTDVALSSDIDPNDPQVVDALRQYAEACRIVRVVGNGGHEDTIYGFLVPEGDAAARWAVAQCPTLGSQCQVTLVSPADLMGRPMFLVQNLAGSACLVTAPGTPWKFASLA